MSGHAAETGGPLGTIALSLYFVDIEASSLSSGSFPIEIAWVAASGLGESHLIRPHDEWLADGCPGWSRESEGVHGISLDTLVRDGAPIEQVAARAAIVLAPRRNIVCSDAPGFDGQWLETLFAFGGQHVTFDLIDVRQVYGCACRPLLDLIAGLEGRERDLATERIRRIANELVGRAEEEESRLTRNRHRALADAEALWRIWRAIMTAVARRVAEEQAR